MFKKPPLKITACILNTVQDISLLLGRYSDNSQIHSNTRLRKANNIRTIKSTVSIEGNTMSLDQVTDVLNGERIIAPEKEIREVKNANRLLHFLCFGLQNVVPKYHKFALDYILYTPKSSNLIKRPKINF